MKKDNSNGNTINMLILIVILGAFLRLYNLGTESIWTDEAVTLYEAEQGNISSIIGEVTKIEATPPGYLIIMHYWISVFGNSEFSIRFPPALFGIASIYIMFLLGSLLFGKKIGLLSSLLLSTAMLQVLYSQEARMYSLFGFLALLSTLLFVKAINTEKNKRRNGSIMPQGILQLLPQNLSQQNILFAFYTLTTLLALYINYMALFLILLQTMPFYFKRYRPLLKKWVVIQSVIFLFFMPLMPMLANQVLGRYNNWITLLPSMGVPPFLVKLGPALFLLPILTVVIASLTFLLLHKRILKINIQFNEKTFIVLLVALGLAYLLSLSYLTRSFALVRHSYFLVPAVYLGISLGITSVKNRKIQLVLIIGILLFNSFALYTYYSKTTKPDWKSAAQYLAENTQYLSKNTKTPSVLFSRAGTNVQILTYYYGDDFRIIDIPLANASLSAEQAGKINFAVLSGMLSEEQGFWLISSRDRALGKSLKEEINNKYTPDITKRFYSVEMSYYTLNATKQ